MAGLFEVHLPTLREHATAMDDRAGGVAEAGDQASAAAGAAQGAVNGGALATASARLSSVTRTKGAELSSAVAAAGSTLRTNADRYLHDDASAASGLDAVDFSAGPW